MTKAVGASIAAVVILTLTVVVIMFVGFIPLPEVGSLQDQPDPGIPGTIAYVESGRDEGCIYRVDASGGDPTELHCESQRFFDAQLSFTTDGHIVFQSFSGFEPEMIVIDGQTGAEIARVPFEPENDHPVHTDRMERADGARILINSDFRGQASLAVQDGTRTVLWEVEDAPRDYHFRDAQWSPDGSWVLVNDSAGRLIILAGSQPSNPRLLVEQGDDSYSMPAWHIPGNDTFTVVP